MTCKRWWYICVAIALGSASGCSKEEGTGDMPGNTPGGSGSDAPSPNQGGIGGTSAPAAAGTNSTPTAGRSAGAAGTPSNPTPTAGSGGSSSEPPKVDEKLDPNVDWTAINLVFSTMYSAYDGVHDFKIPAHAVGVNVELAGWQSIPKGAVIFDPDPDVMNGVMITIAQGVEEITIAARSSDLGGTAKLNVTVATPADWDVGEARYANGVEYDFPELNFEQLIDPNWMPPEPPDNLACNNCHTTGAKYLEIQHTPTQIGNLSDETLVTILTTGMKPEGSMYKVLPEMLQHLYPKFHTWEATEEQTKGLIVYLRSLKPNPMGDVVVPEIF